MLGTSPQMQGLFSFIRKVANTTAPVLLLGESGTGKEMAALAIHRRSHRSKGPFIPINCSAIPENLLESELFGHEKGAFTGAHMQRKGLIESAAGGTLFLDEIGDLPSPIQVKLLQFFAGADIPTSRGPSGASGRRPRHSGNQCRLEERHRGRKFRRRPLLPPGRCRDQVAAASRTGRRYHHGGKGVSATRRRPMRSTQGWRLGRTRFVPWQPCLAGERP